MTTIFGISLVVNSIRAGIDIEPMIGPRTRPRNRSMIVQAAPPATWKKVSGHSELTAMAMISRTITTPDMARPTRGTMSNSRGAGGPAGCATAGPDSSISGSCPVTSTIVRGILTRGPARVQLKLECASAQGRRLTHTTLKECA